MNSLVVKLQLEIPLTVSCLSLYSFQHLIHEANVINNASHVTLAKKVLLIKLCTLTAVTACCSTPLATTGGPTGTCTAIPPATVAPLPERNLVSLAITTSISQNMDHIGLFICMWWSQLTWMRL